MVLLLRGTDERKVIPAEMVDRMMERAELLVDSFDPTSHRSVFSTKDQAVSRCAPL
jgi:hypothetical protein